jgi:hypothetical protein
MNKMHELKAWITATIADVNKDILQCFWWEVDCRRNVCRATDGAHSEVFQNLSIFTLVCKKKFQ